MNYNIEVNLIPDLPEIPFEGGRVSGVCMHATAVYNDTADNERRYECGHYEDAFVHTFSDAKKVLQVASFDFIAFGAGYRANQLYLHNELCQSHDYAEFLKAYDNWTYITAKQLFDLGLGVVDNVTLRSHAQVSAQWHESDHTDPIGYLKEHGVSWSDVVAEVKRKHDEMGDDFTMEQKQFLNDLMATFPNLIKELHGAHARIDVLEKEINSYHDQEVSPWAREYMDKAVAKGLIKGDELGHLNPKMPLNLERFVTIYGRDGKL